MNAKRALVVAVLLSIVTGVQAHEGHAHRLMGTVTAVRTGPDALDVKTTDGKAATVLVDGKTRLVKGSGAATLKDVTVGSRVVVSVVEEAGRQRATEIRLPGAAEGSKKAPPR